MSVRDRLRRMVDDQAHTERDEKVGDGNATVFKLTSSPAVTATVTVAINGTTTTTGYTLDIGDGLVTFTTAPSSAQTVAVTYDTALFTDDEIDSVIDTNLIQVHLEQLLGLPDAGVSSYTIAVSKWQNYTANPTITDSAGVATTVTTYNNDEGHFTLAAATTDILYLTGKACDINAAASDLMTQKAAKYATSVSFNLDGQQMNRSDIVKACMALADSYRAKAWGRSMRITRG